MTFFTSGQHLGHRDIIRLLASAQSPTASFALNFRATAQKFKAQLLSCPQQTSQAKEHLHIHYRFQRRSALEGCSHRVQRAQRDHRRDQVNRPFPNLSILSHRA